MHIIAILLFPVRLVFYPLIPPVTAFMYGLTQWDGPYESYWHVLGITSKAWLLWHV